MTEKTRSIVEGNIINGITEVAKAISEGFYVRNTMAGYPVQLPYYFAIALTNGEKPEPRVEVDTSKDSHVVEGYDMFEWLLAIQDHIVAGYELVVHTITVDNYKGVVVQKAGLSKPTPKVEDETPQTASQAVVEPVVTEAVEGPAPEVVEAPVKPAKAARKPKATKGSAE